MIPNTMTSESANRIYVNRNIPSTQFKGSPLTVTSQIPQAPLRNPLPYAPMYSHIPGSYMSNNGMGGILPYSSPYQSYMPYGQQPGDWRNMLNESGVPQQFQYIENIIRTFTSVSAMMESTLHAIQSSFYSILTVGDHMKQMKSHFGQIYSTLSLISLIKWAINKLLEFFGFRTTSQMNSLWKETVAQSPGIEDRTSKTSFAIYGYLLIIYLGPYLLTRAYNLITKDANLDLWDKTDVQGITAKSIYNYEAIRPDELSIKANQTLKVAPKQLQQDSNWCLVSDGDKRGLVPVNFIHINVPE